MGERDYPRIDARAQRLWLDVTHPSLDHPPVIAEVHQEIPATGQSLAELGVQAHPWVLTQTEEHVLDTPEQVAAFRAEVEALAAHYEIALTWDDNPLRWRGERTILVV